MLASVGVAVTGSPAGAAGVWVAATLPTDGLTPAAGVPPVVHPGGVACVSATSCVAVGYYAGTGNSTDGLIEMGTLAGGTWSWVATAAPTSGLSPPPSSPTGVTLSTVSCGSPTTCIAVGSYYDTSSLLAAGLIETGTLVGGTWTWVASPVPTSGLSPPLVDHGAVQLLGVSCPSAISCVAVGSYENSKNSDNFEFSTEGLIETGTLSAGGWTWVPATAPISEVSPPSDAFRQVALESVSCPTPAACVAVGEYYDSAGNADGLIETGTLSAGAWTWVDVTAPDSGLTPPVSPALVELRDLSCASVTLCVAVGSYDRTTGDNGLVETGTQSGDVWTWTPANAPSTGLSLSCGSATACTALGTPGPGEIASGALSAGAQTWAVASASTGSLDPTAATSPDVSLLGVACRPVTACVAVGNYTDSSGGIDGLTETLSAGPAPGPPGYDLVGSDGGVFVFPTSQSSGFFGSLPGLGVHVTNIVGVVPTGNFDGYDLVGSDGGVFVFPVGQSGGFYGSLPGIGVERQQRGRYRTHQRR